HGSDNQLHVVIEPGHILHHKTKCAEEMSIKFKDTTLTGHSIFELFLKACTYKKGGQEAVDATISRMKNKHKTRTGKDNVTIDDIEPEDWTDEIASDWNSKNATLVCVTIDQI